MPKKIIFVINDLKGNGAERVVITLARELKRQGHFAHILCFKDSFEFDVSDLDVSVFPIKFWRWIPRKVRGSVLRVLLDRFIKQTTGGTPDLVLSNLLPCDRIMSKSRLPNVSVILHNTLSKERGNLAKAPEIALYADKPIVCVSEGVRQDYIKLFPEREKHAITIYNPVDLSWVNSCANEPASLPARPYIIHVGKFKKEKRHDLLVRAFAQAETNLDLVLLGQGPLEETKSLVQQLGLSERIHFLGFKKNPYPYIKAAKLLVLSSDFEGLPTVLLEALALETPAISTNCPSGPSEILPKTSLCPVGDADALSQLLSETDYNVFKEPLRSDFTVEVAVKRYLDLCN